MTDTDQFPYGTTITGPHGTAEPVAMPEDCDKPQMQCHVCTYLITAPGWTPAWDQYVLSVITLADFPGLPPATRQFMDATHELLVMALNPDEKQTVETMRQHAYDGKLPYLQPVNVAEQFIATDDEMGRLAWLLSHAVVNGALPPEPVLGYESHRHQWLTVATKTLAHLRGEPHAS